MRGIEGTGVALGSQFVETLLIQGDVEGGAVFLRLGATATQQRNQQESQGNQQQKAGGEPEVDHLSWLSCA
ncbi:hypothetical protein D3C80_1945210 [compost metagenome]